MLEPRKRRKIKAKSNGTYKSPVQNGWRILKSDGNIVESESITVTHIIPGLPGLQGVCIFERQHAKLVKTDIDIDRHRFQIYEIWNSFELAFQQI